MFQVQPIDSSSYDKAQKEFSQVLCETPDCIDISDRIVQFRSGAVTSLRRQFLSMASAIALPTIIKAVDDLVATLSAAPVIETRGEVNHDEKILMVWPKAISGAGCYLKWVALRESLKRSGANVVSEEIGCSERSLWVRDSAFILGDTAYIPDESARIDRVDWSGDVAKSINEGQSILNKQGLKIVRVNGAFFEGGNLIVDPISKKIFWGDQRIFWGDEHEEAHKSYQEKLSGAVYQTQGERYEIIPIKTDRRHYHLDLGMSRMLTGGEFLVSDCLGRDAENSCSDGYVTLREHLPKERIVTISCLDSARDFAANLEVIGKTLFMTGCSPDLRQQLIARGYTVNVPSEENIPPKSEFWDRAIYRRIGSPGGGGGVHCMTQSFHL